MELTPDLALFLEHPDKHIYEAGQIYLKRARKDAEGVASPLVQRSIDLWYYSYLCGQSISDAISRNDTAVKIKIDGKAFIRIKQGLRDVIVPILSTTEIDMWNTLHNLRYQEIDSLPIIMPYGKLQDIVNSPDRIAVRKAAQMLIREMSKIYTILCEKNYLQKESRTLSQFLRPIRAYALLSASPPCTLDFVRHVFNFKTTRFIKDKAYSWIPYLSEFEDKSLFENELKRMQSIDNRFLELYDDSGE